MSPRKKIIGISLGDPVGIGLEITLKAIKKRKFNQIKFVLYGDYNYSLKKSQALNLTLPAKSIESIANKKSIFIDVANNKIINYKIGKISAQSGKMSILALERSVDEAIAKSIDGIVTAPLHKQSILKAGFTFEGHTEYLEQRTGVKKVVMLLVGGGLKVALITRHMAYRDVIKKITRKEICDVTKIVIESLKKYWGIKNPKIGVMGLNPHASDGGRFGNEEAKIISPAIKTLQKTHARIQGPYPPDTGFHLALKEKWDAEICMYHDQGLIPLKTLAFDSGVNITLGLPFIRTSPDHGTAFDIAGKGIANESSMVAAIEQCAMLIK